MGNRKKNEEIDKWYSMVQMLYHLIKLVKKKKGAKINKLKFAGRIIIDKGRVAKLLAI